LNVEPIVGHPGTNNKYQIDSGSELAMLYNDQSVLENHHISLAWKVLNAPRSNFLRGADGEFRTRVRQIVIQCVLGTDMTKHAEKVNTLKATIQHIQQEDAKCNGLELDTKYKDNMLELALHVADISNPAKAFPIARKWAYRISEEFFAQGDLQKREKMDVLPLFDREKTKVNKAQIGFISFVVQPLFEIWGAIITEVRPAVNVMESSKKAWSEQQ